MMQPVEFWFEFASTYSYPAAMRIEAVCSDAKVPLIWRPFLLGPVFAAQGMTDSPFNLYPVKGRYMWRDMERVCADLGLDFRRPSVFPRGSVPAARIAAHFADASWIGAFVRAVYHANFSEDRDISQAEVIADILAGLNLDPERILQAAQTPQAKQCLRDATEAAAEIGIFGAPSMRVKDELFWGHDRLDQAVAWAARP